MSDRLIRKFESLWKSGDSAPDVFAFLDRHSEIDDAEKLRILFTDQRHRWLTHQPFKVEDYVSRLPRLAGEREYKLQLAVSEYQLRYAANQWLNLNLFISRFPDIGEQLRRKLSEEDTVDPGDGAPSGDGLSYREQSNLSGESIGRYRILNVLGAGAFGQVYLGYDDVLDRPVAIKVPSTERIRKPKDAETFLAEARTVASLNHPNIVPVHDIGRLDDGSVYVVSKFIEGSTLREHLRNGCIGHDASASLLAIIAEALEHAHQQGIIHRDIKPSNILIEDGTGIPYISDFGLAIHEEASLAEGVVVGTPTFMSPEQARAEGHRLDGRSDVFALGAVLYALLTREKPFQGETVNEILHAVIVLDPSTPREIDATIPAELERICLKAMSKQVSDRYASAAELAHDLLHWEQTPEQDEVERMIVPRGLRSFGAADADFFLSLLPGPRNRDGLPESIQFWKTRLEETDVDATFSVGLVYGPSGCGKSSLMKAGLLPRLSPEVRAVYVEATHVETESRILRGIRKGQPEIPGDVGMVPTFQYLRQNDQGKIVIIIDQFEQWLHSNPIDPGAELVGALRQCDGGSLQAVLMVRDDFAMAAARFMDAIDIPVMQGQNFAMIDLFDQEHATNVLSRFGQAFGRLAPGPNEFTDEQTEFLASVTSGLARDGTVVPVQLALFAEMVKKKPWTLSTLKAVGGTEGIGVNFLEETFSSKRANPKHVQHEQAARDVLKALLPDVGSDIKGHMRSQADLMKASGYQDQPKRFNELLRILDGDLRLITPADTEGRRSDSGDLAHSQHYQLTHDYLIPSLREWLQRKQMETKRGRMEIRLQERTALWSSRKEQKQLPTIIEWQGILRHTRRSLWSPSNVAMMRAASRLHYGRIATSVAVLTLLCVVGLFIRHRMKLAAISNRVADLWQAEVEHVPEILLALEPDRAIWVDRVRKVADSPESPQNIRTRAFLALSGTDDTYLPQLIERMLECEADEHAVIRQGLAHWKPKITRTMWDRMDTNDMNAAHVIRATALLAQYSPQAEQWEWFGSEVVDALVSSDPFLVNPWIDDLFPVRGNLLPQLKAACLADELTTGQRLLAVGIIAQFSRTDAEFPEAAKLVDLALAPDATIRGALDTVISDRRDDVLPLLLKETEVQLLADQSPDYQPVVNRKAAAVELAQRLGRDAHFWQQLDSQKDPRVRTVLINEFARADLTLQDIKQSLKSPAPRIRQALLLGLPQKLASFTDAEQANVETTLLELYRTDSDAGVHSAAEYLLRMIGADGTLLREQERLASEGARIGNWRVLAIGLCMVTVERPGSIAIGSPLPESKRDGRLPRQIVTIDYPFEISTTEITVGQCRNLIEDYPPVQDETKSRELPMHHVDLFSAMRFCRRLSEQNGVDLAKCCYPPIEQIGPEMKLAADFHRQPGFRLPTTHEWEYATRAGSDCGRFFGDSTLDLSRYCWWVENSQERLWPVGRKRPNPWGLFDVHGNVGEWCHEVASEFNATGHPMRGGDYRATQRYLSSAMPAYRNSDSAFSAEGFRVVLISGRM